MKIRYDKQIEVSKSQYNYLIKAFAGIIAHRKEDGKYFIKLWDMRYKNELAEQLKDK